MMQGDEGGGNGDDIILFSVYFIVIILFLFGLISAAGGRDGSSNSWQSIQRNLHAFTFNRNMDIPIGIKEFRIAFIEFKSNFSAIFKFELM